MMKLMVLFLIILLGWDIIWRLLGVKPLFPWQLARKLKEDHADLALIDVRTPEEFHWFRIPEAQNMPVAEGLAPVLRLPRTKTVVVICLTGHRSPPVAYRLGKADFAKVYNLTWGMVGWELWKRGEKLLRR